MSINIDRATYSFHSLQAAKDKKDAAEGRSNHTQLYSLEVMTPSGPATYLQSKRNKQRSLPDADQQAVGLAFCFKLEHASRLQILFEVCRSSWRENGSRRLLPNSCSPCRPCWVILSVAIAYLQLACRSPSIGVAPQSLTSSKFVLLPQYLV